MLASSRDGLSGQWAHPYSMKDFGISDRYSRPSARARMARCSVIKPVAFRECEGAQGLCSGGCRRRMFGGSPVALVNQLMAAATSCGFTPDDAEMIGSPLRRSTG